MKTVEIGEDVQAGQAIRLVQDQPTERQEEALLEVFENNKKALGGSFEAFLDRVKRHPRWPVVQAIGRDLQAEQIIAHLVRVTEQGNVIMECHGRNLFHASEGRLGPDFAQFWMRLIRNPAWPKKMSASLPISMLAEGLSSAASSLLDKTECATSKDLLAGWTEKHLLELAKKTTDDPTKDPVGEIRLRLASLGLNLRHEPISGLLL